MVERSILLLLSLLLLIVQPGCTDSPTDADGNPTVTDYEPRHSGFAGMNISAFDFTTDEVSFDVEEESEFIALWAPTAELGATGPGGAEQTTVRFSAMAALLRDAAGGVLDGSVDADVTLRVPGDSTGTFVWVTTSSLSDIEILFSYGSASVLYDKVVVLSIVVTRNDPDPNSQNGASRAVAGSFSAVLESPEGKKIAVKGKFGEW